MKIFDPTVYFAFVCVAGNGDKGRIDQALLWVASATTEHVREKLGAF